MAFRHNLPWLRGNQRYCIYVYIYEMNDIVYICTYIYIHMYIYMINIPRIGHKTMIQSS